MDFHTFIIAVTPYIQQGNFTFENGTATQIKNDINFCQPAHIAFFIPLETPLDQALGRHKRTAQQQDCLIGFCVQYVLGKNV